MTAPRLRDRPNAISTGPDRAGGHYVIVKTDTHRLTFSIWLDPDGDRAMVNLIEGTWDPSGQRLVYARAVPTDNIGEGR